MSSKEGGVSGAVGTTTSAMMKVKRSVSLRNDRPSGYYKLNHVVYSGTMMANELAPTSTIISATTTNTKMSDEKRSGSVSDQHQTGGEIATSVSSGVTAAASIFQHQRFISKVYSTNMTTNAGNEKVSPTLVNLSSTLAATPRAEFGLLLPSRLVAPVSAPAPPRITTATTTTAATNKTTSQSTASIVSVSSTSSVSSMTSISNPGKL